MDNPYLDIVHSIGGVIFPEDVPDGEYAYLARARNSNLVGWSARKGLAARYSWSIPDEAAIRTLAIYNPILEVGAGTGYWASLLEQCGVDIVATDIDPPTPEHGSSFQSPARPFVPIHKASAVEAIQAYPDRTLFLCWPPMSEMASEALAAYTGEYLLYVGEYEGGCCADDLFFGLVDKAFTCEETYRVPQWEGIHDFLSVYRRRGEDNDATGAP